MYIKLFISSYSENVFWTSSHSQVYCKITGTDVVVSIVAGPEGQSQWSKHYPYCGGAYQSPIDIKSDLLRFDPTLRPIEVYDYNLSPNEHLTLGNNGHSGEYVITVIHTVECIIWVF